MSTWNKQVTNITNHVFLLGMVYGLVFLLDKVCQLERLPSVRCGLGEEQQLKHGIRDAC